MNILIYGLDISRKEFQNKVQIGDAFLPVYIDDYNEAIEKILKKGRLKKKEDSKEFFIWETLSSLLKFSEEWKSYIATEEKNWPLWEDYSECTKKNSKNNLKNIYKHKVMGYARPNYIYKEYQQHVPRGCKIGLDIAKKNDNTYIFFLLDGIEMIAVATKADGCYGDTMSSSELRYIYRNWEDLKNKVFFIEHGEVVDAPWKKDSKLWEAYKPEKWKKKTMLELQQKRDQTKTELTLEEKRKNFADILKIIKKKDNHLSESDSKKKVEETKTESASVANTKIFEFFH